MRGPFYEHFPEPVLHVRVVRMGAIIAVGLLSHGVGWCKMDDHAWVRVAVRRTSKLECLDPSAPEEADLTVKPYHTLAPLAT